MSKLFLLLRANKKDVWGRIIWEWIFAPKIFLSRYEEEVYFQRRLNSGWRNTPSAPPPAPLTPAVSREEMVWLAAFCGLGLTEAQRLQLMEPVARSLRETGTLPPGPIFDKIVEWKENRISGEELAKEMFGKFLPMLEEAAKTAPFASSHEEQSEEYWKLLTLDDPRELAESILRRDKGYHRQLGG